MSGRLPVSRCDVIVCGSLHLDIVVRAPNLPRLDETAVGHSWQKVCGGKGGNQAVQAARAGAATAMIGRIGDDAFGGTLRDNLTAFGVDVSCISTDRSQGSGMSVAILQDDGDYGAVIVSGANTMLDPAMLQQQWDALGGAKVLVLQNEVPHAVNVAAARAARASGAQVVLNAAPARDLGDDLLPLVDVLIVNRVEAETLFGVPVTSRASARTAIQSHNHNRTAIVATLGGDGVVVLARTGEVLELLPIPVSVTSSHGAGDCFVGVLAAGLASGQSLFAACATANQKAALYVSRTG